MKNSLLKVLFFIILFISNINAIEMNKDQIMYKITKKLLIEEKKKVTYLKDKVRKLKSDIEKIRKVIDKKNQITYNEDINREEFNINQQMKILNEKLRIIEEKQYMYENKNEYSKINKKETLKEKLRKYQKEQKLEDVYEVEIDSLKHKIAEKYILIKSYEDEIIERNKEIYKLRKKIEILNKRIKNYKSKIKDIYFQLNEKLLHREYVKGEIIYKLLKKDLSKQDQIDLNLFFIVIKNMTNNNIKNFPDLITQIKNKRLVNVIFNEYFLKIKENRISYYENVLLMKKAIEDNLLLNDLEKGLYLIQINIIEGDNFTSMKKILKLKELGKNNNKYQYLTKVVLFNIKQEDKINKKYFYKKTQKEYVEANLKLMR